MTDTELKLALAKMLPEVLDYACYESSVPGLHWIEEDQQDEYGVPREVCDTELLHLVSLAEAKLTDEEYERYAPLIGKLSPWDERTTVLCHILNITP